VSTRIAAFRWIRDHWLAVHITVVAAAVLQVALLIQALSRGLDYMNTPAPSVALLSVIERALPLPVSGWVFSVAAVAGMSGLMVRQFPLTAYAHAVIATFYTMFAAGAVIEVLQRDQISGWRTASAWAVAAIAHAVFARQSLTAWRVARVR
jgi:hypothetical protein